MTQSNKFKTGNQVNIYTDFVVSVQHTTDGAISSVVIICDGKIVSHSEDLVSAACDMERYIER